MAGERRIQTGFLGAHTAKPKLKLPVVLQGTVRREAVGQFDRITHSSHDIPVIAKIEDGKLLLTEGDGKLILSLQEDEVREWLGITLPAPVYR